MAQRVEVTERTQAQEQTLSYERYVGKIRAAWLGKSIGGSIGGPVECHKLEMEYTVEDCWPEDPLPNDDMDIQLVWLDALMEQGPFIDSTVLARYWQDRCAYNFCEYGVFLHNVQRGIMPPTSGWFNNRFFRESMGCPIRSEIWGLVCPGNPELAAEYARMDGQLDHTGTAVYAEQMLSAAISQAFFADDVSGCIEAGLAVIPADCRLRLVAGEVRQLCEEERDWRKARREILRRWGHRNATDALVNQAIVLMALYLGEGDFDRSLLIAANSGWDTDCTAATVGALLGAIVGTEGLPEIWRERIGERVNCAIAATLGRATFEELSEKTAQVGVEIALTRNTRVRILGAPSVAVRAASPQPIAVAAEYPEHPVLWRERATPVQLVVRNNESKAVRGSMRIASPEGIRVSPESVTLTVAPGESQPVLCVVSREGSAPDVISDRNLLRAEWTDERGSQSLTFGLAGARQWRVYGPYWDIFDTREHEVCPFHNEEVKCNPARVPGCLRSAFHQFVYLENQYLDEERLLSEGIPSEAPMLRETGEDCIDQDGLGGFVGEACYYLVRQIAAPRDMDSAFTFGATGPFVAYLNGQEVYRNETVGGWCPYDFRTGPVRLNEDLNRLVVKALRLGDEFCFSVTSLVADRKPSPQGISEIDDRLGDAVMERKS